MIPGTFPFATLKKTRGSGHIIEGSGLFSSNGVLTKTLSSSNTKKWTVEAIVKKAKDGSQSTIFDGGTTNTNYTWVRFETGHNLRIRSVVGSSAVVDLITTQVFRDFGAYLHIVVTYDSANATASERVKLFINGTRVTAFSTATYPSQGQVSIINSAVGHRIGTNDDSSQDFDGYLPRVTFIDGFALAPTDFGEVTADGFWQINEIKENLLSTGADVTGAATDNTVSAAVATTYTFSNQAIGTASSDRVVIVNFGSLKDTSATFSVTSVTIGGVAATQIHSAQTQTSFGLSSYYATVPTGTTANIVIVHSANMNRVGIQVVTTTNVGEFHQVALAGTSSGTDPLSFTVDAPAGSLVVGYVYDTASSSQTWTELTENFDEQISTTHYHSGAIKNYSSAATPTITADPSGSSNTFGLVVVFRPAFSGFSFGTNGFLIEGGTNVAAGTDSSTPDAGYAQNDSIPTMTDTSAPSGTAIFDAQSYPTYAAWKAFDKSTATRWARNAAGQAGWVGYDFGTGKVIKKMIFTAPNSSHGAAYAEMPKNYTIDGWNGSAWVTITTITNAASYSADEQRVHTFTNTNSYNKYRVNITASFDGANCTMGELAMFEGGNGVNHFTKTGTITATNDSPTDDSTNDYGDYCTANPLIPLTAVFTNGNLTSTTVNRGSRGTLPIPPTGKWYFEYTAGNAYPMTGLQKEGGVTNTNGQVSVTLNLDYAGNAAKLYDNASVSGSYGATYGSGDVIGVACDADAGTLTFYKNNSTQGVAKSGMDYAADTWFPHMHQFDTGTHSFNFGSVAFSYTPPANHLALSTANLPVPAVANYEDEYYIEVGISHSNGATTAVTLPKSVSGGAMARIKRTDSAGDWYVVDTVRGPNKFWKWNAAGAEDTSTFTDQTLSGTSLVLPSALATGTYLIEVFYMGSFFQMKQRTGTGSNTTFTFDAALDTAVGHMVIDNKTDANSPPVYHTSLGATKIMQTDNATTPITSATFFQDTAPTTTTVTLGTHNDTNGNSDTLVYYAWANSGPYAFGTYDANNDANGPVLNFSGRPQVIIAKTINVADGWSGNWWPFQEYNPNGKVLTLRVTNALATSTTDMVTDFLSTGVKFRTSGSSMNRTASSYSPYLYFAFGIQPIQGNGKDTSQGRAT